MDVQYSVTRNANGSVAQLLRGTDVVPLSGETQEFCDFLTWDSQQPTPLDASISAGIRGYYFADVDRLVDHLKARGLRLFFGNETPTTPLATASCRIPAIGLTLTHLQQAVGRSGLTHSESKSGLYGGPVDPAIVVTNGLIPRIMEQLLQDTSPLRRLSSVPIRRTFLYLDISDFSRRPPGHQSLIMNALTWITRNYRFWDFEFARDVHESQEAMLCIGDGYIFVFTNPWDATYYGAHLANVIERLVATGEMPVEFHFRMGIHVGKVYCFWDIGRQGWNYIGDGINGGNRVLSAIGKDTDDVLFISAEARQEIVAQDVETEPNRTLLANLHNRGRRNDKHGNPWRVYELNHTNAAGLPTLEVS
jgi:hypothetical protein